MRTRSSRRLRLTFPRRSLDGAWSARDCDESEHQNLRDIRHRRLRPRLPDAPGRRSLFMRLRNAGVLQAWSHLTTSSFEVTDDCASKASQRRSSSAIASSSASIGPISNAANSATSSETLNPRCSARRFSAVAVSSSISIVFIPAPYPNKRSDPYEASPTPPTRARASRVRSLRSSACPCSRSSCGHRRGQAGCRSARARSSRAPSRRRSAPAWRAG